MIAQQLAMMMSSAYMPIGYQYWYNFTDLINRGSVANPTLSNVGGVTNNGNGTYSFDGVNDTLSFGINTHLNFNKTNSFSYAFRFRIDGQTGTKAIFSKLLTGDSNNTGQLIYIDASSLRIGFLLQYHFSTSRIAIYSNNNTIQDGVWANVVCTYNGSGLKSGLNMYINGIKQTTYSFEADTLGSNDFTTTGIACLGSRFNGFDLFFKGTIDYFFSWDRVINDNEIQYLANYYNE